MMAVTIGGTMPMVPGLNEFVPPEQTQPRMS